MVLIPYYIAFCLLCCLLLLVVMRRDRNHESPTPATAKTSGGDGEVTPATQPGAGQAAPWTTIEMAT